MLREQKKLRTLQRFKLLHALKKFSAYARLRSNAEIAGLTRKLKMMLVSDFFSKMASNLKQGTLVKLRRHAHDTRSRLSIAAKTIRRHVDADRVEFYRRLKANKQQIERNRKHVKLSGLLFSLKKYQKFMKKLVFDRWACKSFSLKVKNLEARLEGMKRQRKTAGHEAIRRAWAISKYKKFVESLHQFMSTIDR